MSAWIEEEGLNKSNIEKEFEDNFVIKDKEFQKLDDSEIYLEILGKLSILST